MLRGWPGEDCHFGTLVGLERDITIWTVHVAETTGGWRWGAELVRAFEAAIRRLADRPQIGNSFDGMFADCGHTGELDDGLNEAYDEFLRETLPAWEQHGARRSRLDHFLNEH